MNYKLTTQAMTTRNTQWELGVKQTAKPGDMVLCSDTVLHYYNSPLLAVLLNPIHADIENPRLFEIKTSKKFVTDQLKFGCKSQTILKEIPLPEITTNQKIAFAILCALEVYQCHPFMTWATNWLSGKDRTADAAYAARDAVYAAEKAAAYAARNAANAARDARVEIDFKKLVKQAMQYI